MTRQIRRRPVIAGVVVVLLVVVLIFGGRAAWRLGARLLGPPPPPRQTDVSLIADWMSVPYIGRAYRVPQPELYKALGVEPGDRERRSLREIASTSGRSSDEVLEIVRDVVRAWQASHPDAPRPPGRDGPKPEESKPRGDLTPPTPLRGANIDFVDIISGAERGETQQLAGSIGTRRGIDSGEAAYSPSAPLSAPERGVGA